ncbi:MAG: imidazole glycerol phosphate synthase subunit HisF, partial [Planctomycetota bacterium]
DPELITRAARRYGSQCIVIAIDAKRIDGTSNWEIYLNGGRTPTGKDALAWAREVEKRGAGEILLTSMDCDGTKDGYDNELTRGVSGATNIPIIASGGAGTLEHFYEVFTTGAADAALAASVFHYKEYSIHDVKQFLKSKGIVTRM